MKKNIRQLFIFGIVGIITLLVDVGVTSTLFYFGGLPPYLASAIGFLSGFAVNFPLNRKQVFNHTAEDKFSLKSQIILYGILSCFNLFATSFFVEFLVGFDIMAIQYAKLIVTAIFAIWNFVIFKTVIFSKVRPEHKTGPKKIF